MKLRDIALGGLRGRKKDTLLLKLVITLSFVFIVTSTVFQASLEKTKLEQRLDLYGEWHAAYLSGNQDILENIVNEPKIDKVGTSLIIGESETCGLVGTFNQDLLDMGRFSLYKGRIPEASNEIMVELNQMSNMNLDLEVGQKVQVDIFIQRPSGNIKDYIMKLNQEFYEKGIEKSRGSYQEEIYDLYREIAKLESSKTETEEEHYENLKKASELRTKLGEIRLKMDSDSDNSADYYQHHETPFEQIDDVQILASSDYFYYYIKGEEVNPDIIREKGLLSDQKIILKKEFIITGILQTYTDKWDLGGHPSPNAFITEEGGKTLTDALCNSTLGDFSDHEMDYNMFLYSNSLKEKLHSDLDMDLPNIVENVEYDKESVLDFGFWLSMYGKSDEEVEKAIEEATQWLVEWQPEVHGVESLEIINDVAEKMEENKDKFRRNSFAYQDDEGSTEYILTIAIIAVIFIATALAIFQIFLTQMKRRSRKIVLLKSIGATNSQILKIIAYEGLYLLKTGLIVGVPMGFVFASALIVALNRYSGREIYFHVIPSMLILGMIAGCLSLFVGMAVPMFIAIKIPLTGTMSKPPKHKKLKHKRYNKNKMPTQTFTRINWEYMKGNKGKTFISFSISFIIITISLVSVLLSYFSFKDYLSIVFEKNRPDYVMETFYGEKILDIMSMGKELKLIDGVKSVESYKIGKQTFLWYEGIEENEMLQSFEKLLPTKYLQKHFSKYDTGLIEKPEWINNAFYTKTYGIDPKGELFNKYKTQITIGTLDDNGFAQGEEVILLVPLFIPTKDEAKPISEVLLKNNTNEDNRMYWIFKHSDAFRTTYGQRYKDYYKINEDIKVGDIIKISMDKEDISISDDALTHRTKEVKVGGIIYYFSNQEIWPFSNSVAPYAVIGSMRFMESLYINSARGLGSHSLMSMKDTVDIFSPTAYGRTLIYIYTDLPSKDVVLDSRLLTYANNKFYSLYNYKESNGRLFQEAFNNTIVIGILGFTSVSIAFIILYNIIASKLEQDKNRIGILQALGVTKLEFSKHYVLMGIINGLLSLLFVHLGIFVILLTNSYNTQKGLSMTVMDHINDIFIYQMWKYPWKIHISLCIVFFVLTILIYYLPSRKITNSYPVDNIRSLGR